MEEKNIEQNWYELDLNKQRLWDKFLDVIDDTTKDLSEWASMRSDWDTIMKKGRTIHETKNELKRLLE